MLQKTIALDFADPARIECVPRHGWARNSQGVKILWLPVLRLVHESHNIRIANGLPETLSWGQWSEIRAFEQTVRHFALALRELARCIRLGSDPCFESEDNERRNASYEASSRIPLFVDLSFVYARRLADHFARASRYVLFKHVRFKGPKYENLRDIIADQAKLQSLEPICNFNHLREAFERHSKWFDTLCDSTDENGELQKGIRAIMEHHPITVNVHYGKEGDGPWEVIANLGEPGMNASFRSDLVPTLKEIVADMASLWTMVCESAKLQVAPRPWVAPYGDAVMMTGNDDDSTAFWPESQL